MARGVISVGATQEEAEEPIRGKFPGIRVVRSSKIELGALNALSPSGSFPGKDFWVVVVEDDDPSKVPLRQQADPEGEQSLSSARTC